APSPSIDLEILYCSNQPTPKLPQCKEVDRVFKSHPASSARSNSTGGSISNVMNESIPRRSHFLVDVAKHSLAG
ncbi:unnamed protein product, partial [Clonostachys rosea f. rosea IK726]